MNDYWWIRRANNGAFRQLGETERKSADRATIWLNQAEKKNESGTPAVSWAEWVSDIIRAIESSAEDRANAQASKRSERAKASLRAVAEYLDRQYSLGYDGICLLPLRGCGISWDW